MPELEKIERKVEQCLRELQDHKQDDLRSFAELGAQTQEHAHKQTRLLEELRLDLVRAMELKANVEDLSSLRKTVNRSIMLGAVVIGLLVGAGVLGSEALALLGGPG